jgi:hypothetical protein
MKPRVSLPRRAPEFHPHPAPVPSVTADPIEDHDDDEEEEDRLSAPYEEQGDRAVA